MKGRPNAGIALRKDCAEIEVLAHEVTPDQSALLRLFNAYAT